MTPLTTPDVGTVVPDLGRMAITALDRELLDLLGHAYVSPDKYPHLYSHIARLIREARTA